MRVEAVPTTVSFTTEREKHESITNARHDRQPMVRPGQVLNRSGRSCTTPSGSAPPFLMTTETHSERLWQFATGLYAQAGMSDACLALQDIARADVCVLLYALDADVRGYALNDCQLAQADQHVQALREIVVLPLRRLRRQLKSGFERLSPEATAPVRAQVQLAELAAERLLLNCLQSFDEALADREPRRVGTDRTVASVLALYAPGAMPDASIQVAVIERALKKHLVSYTQGDKP